MSMEGDLEMSGERPVRTPIAIDPALLAAHPELTVLTLDLPDSDGEPMENERERLQMLLLLDALEQYWRGRQDFYAAGNMFVYYSAEQARQILGLGERRSNYQMPSITGPILSNTQSRCVSLIQKTARDPGLNKVSL
jgi:hypothetical protein